MNSKKKALGRGLSALLEDPKTDITSKNDPKGEYVVGAVAQIPLEYIEANPFQPRDHFEKEKLKELSDSIREQGVIQPVTVRKLGYDKYQLISGERRLKASQLAGIKEIPAYIRVANDQQMLEMALVENIQRENLNAIEIAISFKRLIEECKLTQEQLSDNVGKNRATVSNYLRLLKLPAEIQLAIRDGLISMGHARTLITIDNENEQLKLFKQIIDKKLNVRETEQLIRESRANAEDNTKADTTRDSEKRWDEYKELLSDKFMTKVDVHTNKKGKGKLSISFSSENELREIIRKLGLDI